MNNANENQHYVSRVLLERFRIQDRPLQCFQIAIGKWKERSVENVCASRGYTQILESGQTDNTIEKAFSKVETNLPKTFRALEKVAALSTAELPADAYENMCKYCAFLKLTSPVAKAGAVVSFVIQLNLELGRGENYLLWDLKIPEDVIKLWRREYAHGHRVIIENSNPLQVLFRFQFQQSFALEYSMFRETQWTICVSPIEMPMSDVGLVPIYVEGIQASHYILPISPKHVLDGMFYNAPSKRATQPSVKGHSLTPVEAEYRLDCICSSALTQIVCSTRTPNITAALARAKAKGINFHEIPNPDLISVAGQKEANTEMRYRLVPTTEYVRFVHSFIKPKWRLGNA